MNDIFIVCVDGLAGFPEAIQTAFPKTRVQLSIVHLVPAALKYVTHSDSREVIADLKNICQAATVLEAEQESAGFREKWHVSYPTISRQWNPKWTHVVSMFNLHAPSRNATYSTNVIEPVNTLIRKFTRSLATANNTQVASPQ